MCNIIFLMAEREKDFKEKENMDSKEELLLRWRNLKHRIKVKRQLMLKSI